MHTYKFVKAKAQMYAASKCPQEYTCMYTCMCVDMYVYFKKNQFVCMHVFIYLRINVYHIHIYI